MGIAIRQADNINGTSMIRTHSQFGKFLTRNHADICARPNCGHTRKEHSKPDAQWIDNKPYWYYMKSCYSGGGNSTARNVLMRSLTFCESSNCLCFCPAFIELNKSVDTAHSSDTLKSRIRRQKGTRGRQKRSVKR